MAFDVTLLWLDPWKSWAIVDPLTVYEAARLLAGLNPASSRVSGDREADAQMERNQRALLCAVQLGRIVPFAAYVSDDQGGLLRVDADDVVELDIADAKIRTRDLAQWANECGLSHGWDDGAVYEHMAPSYARYPTELRAAIEAFDAVRDDPKATAGKTPKAALAAWLETNKPELSKNARERIATVSNWQPAGGAPETPAR